MTSAIMTMLAAGGGASKVYIEDVFLANTRTGTGTAFSVTGGPSLSTYGGAVHTKSRDGTRNHNVGTTALGTNTTLRTNSTGAAFGDGSQFTAFNSDGFTYGAYVEGNASGEKFIDWIWRNAPKFFTHTVVTKNSGSSATVDLSTLGTVGMVKVKRTDSTGSWYVWHRSLTAGKLLIGETNATETTLGHITVSGTTLTLVNGVIADGTYHIEAYAHDTSADGLIQCGSFTTSPTGTASINVGWEAQLAEIKALAGGYDFEVMDVSRGWDMGTSDKVLATNASSAESTASRGNPTAVGFDIAGVAGSTTFVYKVVRRGPMRFPTSGTQVYNAIARSGTGTTTAITGVGFPPDLLLGKSRGSASHNVTDRLRGAGFRVQTDLINAESSAAGVTSFNPDGVSLDSGISYNQAGTSYINWFFRRYPGVFDQVCYTGTGSAKTKAHNLTVTPEMIIVKNRSSSNSWVVYDAALGNTKYLNLDLVNGSGTLSTNWNNTSPTATVFTVGTAGPVNGLGETYVAYLFATLAGISKVGSYTGTATTNSIDCGFAAGARFALIKRTDSTGDWYLYDSVRGIVAGNDPFLLLNSTAAEDTTHDYIDPYAAGFELSSTAPAGLNANGGTYVFLAIA